MKREIDSQIQREADHRRVLGNSDALSTVFRTIFPTNFDNDKATLRLKIFSKIISLGFAELNDKKAIEGVEEFKIFGARSTKKKIIDSFIKAKLIEKDGQGNFKKTSTGEAAWQSIPNFLDTYKPIEQQASEAGGRCYEYSLYKITVDDKGNCWTLRNFGLKNLSDEPLKFVEHDAHAKRDYKGIFSIEHSDNIERYELISDRLTEKVFRLYFKEPLKKGEYAEFWHLHKWQNQYTLQEQEWEFSYNTKRSIVKEFMLEFNFPKNYQIDQHSIKKNNEGEPLPKDCIPFDPIILKNQNNQVMVWRIKNIYPKRKYIIAWKKKLKLNN